MAITVDIFLNDDSLSPAPIVGAVVSVVDPITLQPTASATTDSSGHASFLLPGDVYPTGVAYQVRAFKLGVYFANPFQILVFEPLPVSPTGVSNQFNLSGTLVGTLQPATDPRCCRCSGRFLNFSNQPVINSVVRISAKACIGGQVPKVVDGNVISEQVMELHTDGDGYIVVDLLRKGLYEVVYAGDDDTTWEILVPDRTSVDFIDLLFPQPVSLTWDPTAAPGNAVTVAVNGNALIPFTVLFSDYEVMGLGQGVLNYVNFQNSDSSVALAAAGDGTLFLTGVAPGTCQITVGVQPFIQPSRVPDYSIQAIALTVTVTP